MTNRKTTKRALFTSMLALLMCVAMLIGTTFAWFTDTASTSVNKVQAGTLKVALEMKDGEKWVDAKGKTLDFIKATNASEGEAILWEPGCTYELPALHIRNDGNLALKYKVVISGIEGDAKLNEAIDWMIAYSGTATTAATTSNDETPAVGDERSLGVNESHEFTIAGTMKTTAGNEYMGLSIDGIAITVVATQDTVEYDSNNNEYDKDAAIPEVWDGHTTANPTKSAEDKKYHITSAAEFYSFVSGDFTIEAGSDVVLDCDVDLAGATVKGYANSVFDSNFDGQGHTVRNFTVKTTYFDNEHYCGLFPYIYAKCSVKNLTVENAVAVAPDGVGMVGVIAGAAYDKNSVENCHAINCVVIGEKKVGSVLGYTTGAVSNCSATNCDVYCNVAETDLSNGKVQADEIVGYVDGSDSLTDCTDTNVTVKFNTKPVTVSTAEELKAALDNTGNNPTNNRSIVLLADIDGSNWTAISAGSNYPAVMINGNGHTISNLSSCLFSSLPGRDYVFKNLTFTDVNLTSASGSNAGIAVLVGEGQANGGGSYTITNCHIKGGTIAGESNKYVGGFIGFKSNCAEVKFVDCTVTDVSLTSSEESIGAFAGHLYDKTTFENCAVKGNTSVTHSKNRNGDAAKGGILVGTVYGAKVTNCTIDSTVTLSNTNAASTVNNGLFGRNPVNASITVN